MQSAFLTARIYSTRPKPAYGRQGLDWNCWARIQFSQVHFGAKLDSTDLLWCKNVTSPTGGSNRPFRCLEEGGRALPKFLEPFQNVSKKHSGYDLLLNKYSGNQPKTMKNHETTLKTMGNQPKTMKNQETTLKNHGNQPKT